MCNFVVGPVKVKVKIGSDGKPLPETTGHVWDENLSEQNNPLPKWWMWLFYLTLIYSVGLPRCVSTVLVLTKANLVGLRLVRTTKEMKDGEAQYGPLFNKYLSMDVAAIGERSSGT